MDKLKDLKIQEFKKALNNLKASSVLEYSDISRDSTLLRFELTSEILWKSLKIYLSDKFQIEAIYPNDIYRQAGKIKLISIDDVELALNMISDRNRMVHDYNQEWSDELYKKL
jgi:nucleotidyltransferase substrate binding protein (TIGR01987 family)